MPIVKIENINEAVSWGLWKIDEDFDFLIGQTVISDPENEDIKRISNVKRRLEWAGARLLLKKLADRKGFSYKGISKDDFDKPFLIGNQVNISISHCYPYACAMLNDYHPCGIDIEKPKPALFQVARKFLNDQEKGYIPEEENYLCLAWAAKEVLYKIHGKKHLNFQKHIMLKPFELMQKGTLYASVSTHEIKENFKLWYITVDGHFICFNL